MKTRWEWDKIRNVHEDSMEIGQKMEKDTRTRQELDKNRNGHKGRARQEWKWTQGQDINRTRMEMDIRLRIRHQMRSGNEWKIMWVPMKRQNEDRVLMRKRLGVSLTMQFGQMRNADKKLEGQEHNKPGEKIKLETMKEFCREKQDWKEGYGLETKKNKNKNKTKFGTRAN